MIASTVIAYYLVDHKMKFVNRCVVTLKPKTDFVVWVQSLEGIEQPEAWEFEGGVYLFDEQETEEQLLEQIAAMADLILENECSIWTQDRQLWPSPQNLDCLRQCFDLHISVACFDTGRSSLMRADLMQRNKGVLRFCYCVQLFLRGFRRC